MAKNDKRHNPLKITVNYNIQQEEKVTCSKEKKLEVLIMKCFNDALVKHVISLATTNFLTVYTKKLVAT